MSDMKWLRFIRKLKPYNIQKGLRYLKHYGPKEFLIRLSERMEPEEVPYGPWREQYCAKEEDLARQKNHKFSYCPKISVVVPAYRTPEIFLRQMIESLEKQSYENWELVIGNASPEDETMARILKEYTGKDPRVKNVPIPENIGIAENTNAALAAAAGNFVGFMDHDDLLAPDALFEIAIRLEKDPSIDAFYTDEDKVSADGTHFFEPHLKPDFAPDSLRSGNYICHITAASRALMNAVGGLRPGFDGSQDYDLALRLSENAAKITHIPRILYHWRMLDTSFSHQKAQTCADAAARAVADQLRRLLMDADVTVEELRVRIRWKTRQMRIVCVLWGEGDAPKLPMPCIRVRDLSAVNDLVRRTDCGAVLFLRAGLRPLDTDWVSELMQYAQRVDVGCVGSALLDDRDCFRHAGYAVGVPGGAVSHQAGQWRYGRPYMLTDRIVRNVTGVSSALLMIRRDVFLAVGGFSPYQSDLRGADLGLKCQQIGLLNVYTPYARMAMDTRLSLLPPCLTQGAPKGDLRRFRQTWGAHPPERYYSPLFRPDGSMFIDLDRQEGTP